MITAPPRPNRRAPIPAPTRPLEGVADLRPDPADLAATLRDLAARAHRAVRAFDSASVDGRGQPPASALDALRELAALHPQIVAFQRTLDADSQRGLASYLAALRREVERRLG